MLNDITADGYIFMLHYSVELLYIIVFGLVHTASVHSYFNTHLIFRGFMPTARSQT